ncbi:MAG: hypothetical protein RL514_2728 [Verrucomicrobiota bacterium]|jgi:putative heme-binding domain-containing protein
MKPYPPSFLGVALLFLVAHALAAAPAPKLFTEGVRDTAPLSPEEQRLKFHLPPGFKIQLVAAEPDLRKPMNMAFDSAGRLWVTESREYPFAATNAALARDTIRIFSDFDDNGRARKITTFATNLNIPIGIYPFRAPRGSGQQSAVSSQQKTGAPQPAGADRRPLTAESLVWKCLAWSIPHIWLFEDTDGDGVADKQEKFLGPFDFSRDTHGNQASFRRGSDGWIYATHGFNNQSRVAGTDGHEIFLPSGNVYRFRLDGSRVEHWTHGQVNPFGLTFDPLGNLYSADCHSSPIYQLLRSAHYPSFGRPHDGLGFAPTTIQHSHGSTAIGGIVHISDPSWPAEFQDNLFIGNVLTSRINRDQLEWHGSTSVGKEKPDFLSTDDPWFRPVDLQFGPDGALWVADFYNRIIGHYEVPLLHPGRDRDRGRIWRIVPPVGADVRRLKLVRDEKSTTTLYKTPDLIEELGSLNPTRRLLAQQELTDCVGTDAVAMLKETARGIYDFPTPQAKSLARVHSLWALLNLRQLDDLEMNTAIDDPNSLLRGHLMRLTAEISLQAAGKVVGAKPPHNPGNFRALMLMHMDDPSAHVQRAAADALAVNPHPDNLPPLLALQKLVPAEDTHLAHVVRMALREQLRQPGAFAQLSGEKLPAADARAFAALATSLTNAEAATFLVRHVETHTEPADVLARYVTHAARYAPDADLPKLATLGRKQFAADLDIQATLFKAMVDGQTARGGALPADLHAWGTDLAGQLLAPAAKSAAWTFVPLNLDKPGRNPFAFEERTSADGQKTRLMSSFPHGETLTGVLRSPVFVLPKQLSFYLCGHDGIPGQPAGGKNHVRLRLVADTEKAQLPSERSPISPRRTAILPLPAGEGRGEGESGLPPNAFSFTPAGDIGRRPEADPSRVELPAALPHPSPLPLGEGTRSPALGHPQAEWTPRRAESGDLRVEPALQRSESSLQPRREEDSARRPDDSTRRQGNSTHRPDDSARRDCDSLCREEDSTRREEDSTRREEDSTRREDDSIRREDASTLREDTSTWRADDSSRRQNGSSRRTLDSIRQEYDSTGQSAVPSRLAAAPAVGDLPKGVVREAKVPRNDTAQKITWDLADLAGKRAVIEVTDGDDGKAYAWLAFGRFVPALPELTLGEVQSLARRQQSGADLARSLKLATLEPAVAKLFTETTDASVRAAAGRAWLALNATAALPKVEPLVRDAVQPENLRAELAAQLGEQAEVRGLAVVVAALTNAPSRLQTKFAAALVSTAAGAEQLLAAAESGRIAARLLQDRTLTDRLRASPARDASARLAALVKNLPAADVQLHKQIEAKRAGFDAKQANAGRGAEVFAKACAVCHLLEGKGALVGPQLDGIGGRGLERLLEDVLDPNRNVDKAFRTTVFVLKDGETLSGLARREEGGAFIYALANGQEARVPKADVKERRETETSLMPANFIEALTAAELNDLLTFLLSKSGGAEGKR